MGPRLAFYKEDIQRAEKLLRALVKSREASGAQLMHRKGHLLAAVGNVDQGPLEKEPLKDDLFLIVTEPHRPSSGFRRAALEEFLDEIADRKEEGERISREFGSQFRGPGRPA